MGIQNSHGEEKILKVVIETLGDGYAFLREQPDNSVRECDYSRDVDYIRQRFFDEGIEFLTVTLPRLGEWFDQQCRQERVERVAGFKPYDGLFPCFLRPFWKFFHEHDFAVDADTANGFRIFRTLLLGCKKLNVPCSAEKTAERLAAFESIESVLEDYEPQPNSNFMLLSQRLCEEYMRHYSVECAHPQHGPGAVAGGERLNAKWKNLTLYESVHAEFPYWDFMFPVRSTVRVPGTQPRLSPLQLAANAAAYRAMPRLPSPAARLLLVPKDSRGPRVISCEPKELMYLQQGVSKHLVRFIERHPWTRGHVNFTDQTINNRMALSSSSDKLWDTIDLSDASDRVSVALVQFLFPKRVTDKWFALRSTATLLPDGRLLPLHKFAPMGSALCFPVEALVFWSLAVGVLLSMGHSIEHATASVFVYGDDIIIRRGYTHAVMDALESCCLKVNRSKSFTGDCPFRESCGVEALSGFDVTPSRIRMVPPSRPSDGSGLFAYAAYASNCWSWAPRRAREMERIVKEHVGEIPHVPFEQPFLSIVTDSGHWTHQCYNDLTWDPECCYYTSRQYTLRSKRVYSEVDSWNRLQNNLSIGSSGHDPSHVVDRQSTQMRLKRVSVTYLHKLGV